MNNFVQHEFDPFEAHPHANLFLEEAFVALEQNAPGSISVEKRQELAATYGLGIGEAAALAYLARIRAEQTQQDLDRELIALQYGGL